MIYFLQADDGPVKIGRSSEKNFMSRFTTMQTFNHHELSLLRPLMIGSVAAERWLHNYFFERGVWRRGEWFDPHPDMETIEPPKHLQTEGESKHLIGKNLRYSYSPDRRDKSRVEALSRFRASLRD